MNPKRNHWYCPQCDKMVHNDVSWKENSNGDYVCEDCAEDMPVYFIENVEGSSKPFYGWGEFGVRQDTQTVTTQRFVTRSEAKTAVLDMINKQWDCDCPIDGGE